MNAIAQDPLTGEIVDPFGGVQDLKGGVLRVVDAATFVEDPLRVLRAMQIVARFNLTVDPVSFDVLRAMVPSLSEISAERVGDEWRKLLLLSEKPSLGLAFGMDVGAFALLHPRTRKARGNAAGAGVAPGGERVDSYDDGGRRSGTDCATRKTRRRPRADHYARRAVP